MRYCPILFLTRPASYCDTFIREVQSLCLKYVVTSGQSLASRFPVFNLCAKLCEPARGELLLPVSQPRYRLLSAQLTWGICTNQHLSPRTTPNSSLLSVTLTSQAPLPQTSSSIPACWAVFSARCSENTAITHCFLLGAKIPLHWLQFSFFFFFLFFFFFFGIQRNVFLTVVLSIHRRIHINTRNIGGWSCNLPELTLWQAADPFS